MINNIKESKDGKIDTTRGRSDDLLLENGNPSFIREILNEMPEPKRHTQALPLWSVTWRRRSFYLLLS